VTVALDPPELEVTVMVVGVVDTTAELGVP
jgi:hypothetical protein